MPVLGMTCAACVRHVEKAARAVPHVKDVQVNLVLSQATFTIDDPNHIEDARRAAAEAIRKAGYEVPADALRTTPLATTAQAATSDTAEATGRARVVIAVASALPVIVVAMAHGRLIADPLMDGGLQAVLATLCLVVVGRRFFRAAWHALAARSADMNVLIALGALASWGYSLWALAAFANSPHATHGITHRPHLYFEAAATILMFITIGKYLEDRAKANVATGVRELAAQLRGSAWREVPAEAPAAVPSPTALPKGAASAAVRLEEVSADALTPGDIIVVQPGARIAADGTVLDGNSEVDEALLTGESKPARKETGSAVFAGTLNQIGILRVRVARVAAASTIGRIADTVVAAQQDKAPIARLADRISAWFVPIVLVIAAATALAWWLAKGDSGAALTHAVAVLVIACPCALGIATPAAIAVATSRGASLGVLFRSGAAIEATASIDSVVFDKTGTLTTGERSVVNLAVAQREKNAGPPTPTTEAEALAIAAALESGSEHSLARALQKKWHEARASKAATPTVEVQTDEVPTVIPGHGVQGRVAGQVYRIGHLTYVLAADTAHRPSDGAAPPLAGDQPALHAIVATMPANATAVWLAQQTPAGYALCAVFVIDDEIAPAAKPLVAHLADLAITVHMASGDAAPAARAVAAAVGIPEIHVHSQCTPYAKVELVQALAVQHRVAMVGDGINDAPALAAATVGIAVEAGTEMAAAAAHVRIVHGGLHGVVTAFGLARATQRIIWQNLGWAFVFNVCGIALAAGVFAPWTRWQLTPMFASAAMSASSVTVLANSMRLRRWRLPAR